MAKRKLVGKGVKSPKKTPEQKIKEIGDALKNTRKTPKKKEKIKTEELTETEQILLSKILTAYLAQYPLITKGKKPSRYAHNHKMAESLRKKLVRMKLIEEVKEKNDR